MNQVIRPTLGLLVLAVSIVFGGIVVAQEQKPKEQFVTKIIPSNPTMTVTPSQLRDLQASVVQQMQKTLQSGDSHTATQVRDLSIALNQLIAAENGQNASQVMRSIEPQLGLLPGVVQNLQQHLAVTALKEFKEQWTQVRNNRSVFRYDEMRAVKALMQGWCHSLDLPANQFDNWGELIDEDAEEGQTTTVSVRPGPLD